MKTVILKLGGSLITRKKSSRSQPKIDVIKGIAKELADVYKKKPYFKLILLHGAGSFGHHLVWKYKLLNHPLNSSSVIHVGQVVNSVRQLGSLLCKIFLGAGLPVIPLQTSSLAQFENNEIVIKNKSAVDRILKYRAIPVLGGDIIIGKKGSCRVISADDLSVLFSNYFKKSVVLFATNVDGVYKNFPPKQGEKPLESINRKDLRRLIDQLSSFKVLQKYDVTGEMAGKLKKILQLRNRKILIFNGQKPLFLKKALLGKKGAGTSILL